MSTPTNAVFGARVRQRRLGRELGLREVARLLHVSPGWLSRLERGYEGGISTIHLRGLAGRVPPDVIRALQRRPELCDLIRTRSPEARR